MGPTSTPQAQQPPADRDTRVQRDVQAALQHYRAVQAFEAAPRSQRPMLACLVLAIAAAALLAGCGGTAKLAPPASVGDDGGACPARAAGATTHAQGG